MKKVLIIFIIAFILNAVWENLHSFLYDNYKNGEITEFILLRATLADAIMITIITLPFILIPVIRKRDWIIVPIGIILATCIELWALNTGRWAYNTYMPIIPLLKVGLTPIIQLGLLGYISFRMSDCCFRESLNKI